MTVGRPAGVRSRRRGARLASVLALVLLVTALPDAGTPPPAEAVLPQHATALGAGFHNWSDDTGITVADDGNVYVWGNTSGGRDGRLDTPEGGLEDLENTWPRKVAGLPEGSIVSVAATQWNASFAALDTSGYVWMWGLGTAKSPATACPSAPFRIRIGRGLDHAATPAPVGAWDDTTAPLLSGVRLLTAASNSFGAITASGEYYTWRAELPAGRLSAEACSMSGAFTGASMGLVLAINNDGNWARLRLTEEHRAVSLRGGWSEATVVLEDGRVGVDIGGGRPSTQDGTAHAGTDVEWGHELYTSGQAQLDQWTRDRSPSAYVVAVDTGYDMGAALLSDGSVLTWGRTERHAARPAGAGDCATRVPARDPGATCAQLNRSGALATAKIVAIRAGKTSVTMVDDQGNLIGYSAEGQRRGTTTNVSADPTEVCLPQWPTGTHPDARCSTSSAQVPGVVATGVESFSSGSEWVSWRERSGTYTGLGRNTDHVLGNGAAGPTNQAGLAITFLPGAGGPCDPAVRMCDLAAVHPAPVPAG